MTRIAAYVFAAVGMALLPWAIWLSSSLQPHHRTHNWDLAWSGFDSGLAISFLLTAYATWKRLPWMTVSASATGALLLADAWFDIVLESRSSDVTLAVVEAFVGEVPLAALCFAVALVTSRDARTARGRA